MPEGAAADSGFEERYALVCQAVAEGIYEWDIERNALFPSARLIEIFGFEGRSLGADDWNEIVHPEDFPIYRAALRDCFRGVTARLDCEYRVRHSDGAYRWIEDRALAVRNKAGRATRLVGAVSDITARKEIEQNLREALEQQTATAEVLQVINSSPGDLAPVFDAMLEKAMRLCEAAYGVIRTYDGQLFHEVARRDEADVVDRLRDFSGQGRGSGPIQPGPNNPLERLVQGERVVHIADLATEAHHQDAANRERIAVTGARTWLAIALQKEGLLLGTIIVHRREALPFTDKQIALLQSFAAQAVIAMENARLLTETREALERQTATAEILRVISSSPTDVQPTFDAIAAAATTLTGATNGSVFRFDGRLIHFVAHHGLTAAELDAVHGVFPVPPGRGSLTARAILTRQVVHVADMAADPEFKHMSLAQVGLHTGLYVPMLRDGDPIGAITVTRNKIEPFSDKQIDLLKTFADQAVIAIENVRLFNELSERTGDLQESLEYQTATSDVLKVISQSTFDLEPVLQTVLDTAMRLCGNIQGSIFRLGEDGLYRQAVGSGMQPEYYEIEAQQEIRPGSATLVGRTAATARPIQITDAWADPDYAPKEDARVGQLRSMLGVPLLREGTPIGVICTARTIVKPFTEKEIELVATFADQAVIAIENARLLGELRQRTGDLEESLEYQTATSDVLKVISRSTFDLQPVLDALLQAASRLCGNAEGALALRDGNVFRCVAVVGITPEFEGALREHTFARDRGTTAGRVALEGRVVHIADVTAEPEYTFRETAAVGGIRTTLGVPLLRQDETIGIIVLFHRSVEPFTERQIELVRTFADQAVIAIENTRLITETQEALKQQTATAEVLQVINSSPGDLAPVFDAMLERATRLSGASFGILWLFDGGLACPGALHRVPEAFAASVREPQRPSPESGPARVMRGEAGFAVADLLEFPAYQAGDPMVRAIVDLGGARSLVITPLRKDGITLGAITIYRQEVQPFTDKQIALLESFAAQAVIAMENARLLGELRERTSDLEESLEYQTATSDVLKVISGSTFDIQPVFETIVATATRLCGADFAFIAGREGEAYRVAATVAAVPEFDVFLRSRLWSGRETLIGRTADEGRVVHIADVAADAEFNVPQAIALGKMRTALGVPLLREGVVVGVIGLARERVQPFTDRQIELVRTFADQAVIALENARLITEQREALEQQTATAEILQVINSSPGDLAPVFDAVLEKAHSLCGAAFGALAVRDSTRFHAVALRGLPEAFAEIVRRGFEPGPGNPVSRLIQGEPLAHIADMAEVAARFPDDPVPRAGVELGGVRTILFVPLRKENTLLGFITAYRQEVRLFSDKQVALLQNFAAQAVIAMDNARLLSEIRQRQAELRVTFDNMGDGVVMFDSELRLAAWNRNFQEMLELPDAFLAEPRTYKDYIRILLERGEIAADDIEAELSRRIETTDQELRLERTRPDGRVIEVRRNAVPGGGFVLIYGDITERKRAEAEIRAARDAAEAALGELKTAQANLIQAEKMASLGQLTAGIAHEIKNPLNFVNNFADLSVELLDELKAATGPAIAGLGEDARAEIDETVLMLTSNLEKIAEHGRRADGIVKSMLEHSRGATGDRREVDLNGLVEEALNLAYHGARAQDQNFNITLEREFGAAIAPVELVPQDVTRVFLNLIGNGFYAASKRREKAGAKFKPVLTVTTRDLGDAVEVAVKDNGIGIGPELRDKLFQPFFTTKPTGEGTGLGLSISYDIVTQEHGGTITVDSRLGEFTEFTVRLPRAATAATAGGATTNRAASGGP